MRTMAVGEFKAKCLAVLAEVNSTGKPLLVTKRGVPLARVLPSDDRAAQESPEAIFGSLRHMAVVAGDLVESEFPDEEWERMFNEKWDRFDVRPKQ